MRHCILMALTLLSACEGTSAPVTKEETNNQAAVAVESKPSVEINAPSLIGMKKVDIDRLWGTPECPPKNSCDYGEMREVYFVNGLAANLTLPPVDDLRLYHLELGSPNFENPDIGLKVWDTTISGRKAEIRSFPNYVYIKTAET